MTGLDALSICQSLPCPYLLLHFLFHLPFHFLLSSSLSSSLLSLSVSVSVSVWCCSRVVVLWCGVVWCVVLWCVMYVITFSCLVMGSLLALSTSHSLLLSLFVYGLRRCTASLELGDCRPVRQTELIIGIRDVHNAVSAWTSRTTLRCWIASKTTCSTAQVSVRHLAGEILQSAAVAEASSLTRSTFRVQHSLL